MRRLTLLAVACGVAAAGVPPGLAAQWAPGSRAAGMAGAGLVFATGVDAVEWNPANLAFSGGWTFSLMDVGGASLLTGTTLFDAIDIATANGEGDPALVTRLPAGGFRVEAATEGFAAARAASAADLPGVGNPLPTLGLTLGHFGLRVRSRVLADASVSREFTDLIVNGYNPDRIREYSVGNTRFRVASFSEVTAAYAVRTQRLAVGVAAHFVKGQRLSQGRLFEPVIDLNAQTMEVTAVAVEAPGGTGYGFDLGMALNLGGGVRLSLAAENLFQRMTWDQDLEVHQATYTDDDFDDLDLAELVNRFTHEPVDPGAVSVPVLQASLGLFEESWFPTVERVGLGWAGSSGTRIEVMGSAVAPRGRQHTPWDQRVSVGAEQRLGFLTLRGGWARATSGLDAISAGIGFRLGPLAFDAGAGKLSGSYQGLSYDGIQGNVGLTLLGGGA